MRERQVWDGPCAVGEGCSIRATERLTDIHRDTIMRLGVRVGDPRVHFGMLSRNRGRIAPSEALTPDYV